MAATDDSTRPPLVVSEEKPRRIVIEFSGELDIVSVDGLEHKIRELLKQPAEAVALSVADLTFMDSSGIALLLRIANQFGPLDVRGANAQVRRVIETLGLTDILRMEDVA